jgi:1-acyl-sn-glycerol-3-phosphate acyltransferase
MKESIEAQNNLVWFLKQYFRYEIRGQEKLDSLSASKSPYLLLGNHSVNFIDPLLLIHSLYDRFKVAPSPIGYSSFLLENPIMRGFADKYDIISHKDFRKISTTLKNKKSILAYPGGYEEGVLRNFTEEPYKLKWREKIGLIKIIVNHNIPIVFVAKIGADELVTQSNAVKMPSISRKIFGMVDEIFEEALQMWTVAIHPPIKVTHIITDPIYPSQFLSKKGKCMTKEEELESLQKLEEICQLRLDHFVENRHLLEDDIDKFIKKFINDSRNYGL